MVMFSFDRRGYACCKKQSATMNAFKAIKKAVRWGVGLKARCS